MDDLISRQAAIDTVHKVIFNFFDLVEDDDESPMTYLDKRLLEVNKALTNELKELHAAQPTHDDGPNTLERWISVEERLPVENGRYLVTRHVYGDIGYYEEETDVYIHRFQNGEWVQPSYYPEWINDALTQEVTAWMPLPEPYGGGQDG